MTENALPEPFRRATMDEVQGWIDAGDVVVYDANNALVHAQNHLPGARHASGDWTAGLPAAKDARLVFYCSGPT